MVRMYELVWVYDVVWIYRHGANVGVNMGLCRGVNVWSNMGI